MFVTWIVIFNLPNSHPYVFMILFDRFLSFFYLFWLFLKAKFKIAEMEEINC